MARDWSLQLVVDARDVDAARAVVAPGGGEHGHIAVRTGPVLIRCLDGAAVTSTAAAWAVAHASSAHLLPIRPVRPVPAAGVGVAAPAGDVVIDGHQRWEVIPPRPGQPYAQLTSEWLAVRVHDIPALDSYTRAWAQACALGGRVLRTPPVPFAELLRNARDVEAARRFALPDRSDQPGRSR